MGNARTGAWLVLLGVLGTGAAACGPGLEPPERSSSGPRAGSGEASEPEPPTDASGGNPDLAVDAGRTVDEDLDSGVETPHTSDDDAGG
jgi:hypothetical protein